jgi:hypothetical protein
MQAGGHASDLTGKNLSCLGDKFAEKLHITEIDCLAIDINPLPRSGSIHPTGFTAFFNDHIELFLRFCFLFFVGFFTAFLFG